MPSYADSYHTRSEPMSPRRQIAYTIKSATDLRALLDGLRRFQDTLDADEDIEHELGTYGINIAELPTFGGEPPQNIVEVWSWDTDRLLVGVGPFSDWRIVDRAS